MKALGWALLAAVVLRPASAEACSVFICQPEVVLPSGPTPANLPGFFWSSGNRLETPGDPTLFSPRLYAGTSTVELPSHTEVSAEHHGYFIIPDVPLAQAVPVRLEINPGCDTTRTSRSVFMLATRPGAALPTSLGALIAQAPQFGPIRLATSDGSCVHDVDSVYVDLELAEPNPDWNNAFLYSTVVDGVEYRPFGAPLPPEPGSSWQGRGSDRIYAVCATSPRTSDQRVSEGTHSVTIRGQLPGSTIVLESDPISVELQCPRPASPANVDAEGGCSCVGARAPNLLAGFLALGLLLARKRRALLVPDAKS